MTNVRKITPEQIATAVSELNRELKSVGAGTINRIDCSPENIEQGLDRGDGPGADEAGAENQ